MATKKRPASALRLDVDNGWVWQGQQRLELPPKAFTVLRYLVEHAGRVVSKEELLRAAWPDVVVSEWALTTCLREIRKALQERAQDSRYIQTVHRRGYRFIGKVVSDGNSSGVRRPMSGVKNSQSAISSPPAPSVGAQSAINMVGRERELAQLHGRLEKALHGERQIVFITGEAGIGKTTLVEAFLFGVQDHKQFETTESLGSRVKRRSNSEPVPSPQPLAPMPWIGRHKR